jgi:hypothetical protein
MHNAFREALQQHIEPNETNTTLIFSKSDIETVINHIMQSCIDAAQVVMPPSLQTLCVRALVGQFFSEEHPQFEKVLRYKDKPITHYERMKRDAPIMIVYNDGVGIAYLEGAVWIRNSLGIETQNLQQLDPRKAEARLRYNQFSYSYLMVSYRFTAACEQERDHSMQTRELFNIYTLKECIG